MNKHSSHHRAWSLLCSLLLMTASSVQAATTIAFSSLVIQEPDNASTTVYGSPGTSSTLTYFHANGMAAAAYGMAQYGALHASASAAGIAGPRNQTRGQGDAFWIDQLTITNAALTGQSAFARAGISLSGGLASYSPAPGTGVGVGNSTVGASVTVGNQTVFSTTGQLMSWNGVVTTDFNRGLALNGTYQSDPVSDLTGTFWFDIPFLFGTEFQLGATVNAFAQAMYEANAASDFSHSIYWEGISNVHLADGTVLTDYGISSLSGFDWINPYLQGSPGPGPEPGPGSPVPAPATVWLVGAGLLGLVGVRRGDRARSGRSALSGQGAAI